MASGKGLICKLGKHIPITGADRIVQVDMFGETVITQKNNEEGAIGILFDMDTSLSHDYASKNDMYRHSDLNSNKKVVGYLEDDRRIRPVRLKGVKCSALFMPIETLSFRSTDIGKYPHVGMEIDSFDGVQICEKYVTKSTKNASFSNKGGTARRKNLVPTFKENIDTDQWSRNTHKVQEGNLVIITEKLHGTSGRCGYLPIAPPKLNWWQKLCLTFGYLDWKLPSKYEFVVGSRRTVKSVGGNSEEDKEHFYNENLWTKISKEYFQDKLRKGETVYFEIVGSTPSGETIMPSVSNKKLEKFLSKEEYKEFINKYGDTTIFSYGCQQKNSNPWLEGKHENLYKVFVYRITTTNEDGDSVDYSWAQLKKRCEQIGVEHVPELDGDLVPIGFDHKDINDRVQFLTDQHSSNFPQHVREGVCIRIENGNMTPLILKHKSFIFKVLEGIIKDTDTVDMEESN